MAIFVYFQTPVQKVNEVRILAVSGAGNVCFLRPSCTFGYKHETFRLCSSNLSCKYFLVSHRNFSIFKMANGNFKMAAKFI